MTRSWRAACSARRTRRPRIAASRPNAVRRAARAAAIIALGDALRRSAAEPAILRPEIAHRRHRVGSGRSTAVRGARDARHPLSAALLAGAGMVLAGRHSRHRDSLLSRPSGGSSRIERRFMREVEGGNRNWLMRILRHEAGHAVDSAYRLRRRRGWREVFGPASLPYPDTYRPRPGSRRFVQHLGRLVCPGASHRGFRRDLRRVAQAAVGLAPRISGLAAPTPSSSSSIGSRPRSARRSPW